MTLRVIEPGLYTLVVDRGRPHTRGLGVSVGGAADFASFALGNALVGNPPDTAALEITLAGPKLQSDCPLACVVFGAPFELFGSQQGRLKAGTTFTLQAGETLSIGSTPRRARAYFCVRGGIPEQIILGSRTSFEPICAGQEWPCASGRLRGRFVPLFEDDEPMFRTLPGAQVDWFRLDDFYDQCFVVTPASNRMGIRLQGQSLRLAPPLREWPELDSEPVCPGTIQVTRDGQCVILGVDGQTIGGYAKIAHVIRADLDRIGQLRPGDRISFRPVDLQRAREAWSDRQARLQEMMTRLRLGGGSENC
ncbi:MAG: urea amidolyase [Gemmatales bacterium]|nr:MAG: urea amidolyase [Gemmatales bacterium]